MNTLSTGEASQAEAATLPMRPAGQVMDLERLGSLHQSRLSFMRALVRRIMRERWRMDASRFELDADGHGTAIYRIHTPNGLFSFVLFSQYLAPEKRNDRVIASEWDLTMALCEGEVDPDQLDSLRRNVPLQEAGRLDARTMVLSRANRSVRNFDYVVDALARGRQPDAARITRVGYLYRTTAVYGSGKLGMADWEKIRDRHPDFARPFAAEMFTCFMLRNFSLRQAEHIARHRAPATAVALEPALKRYFGIGNSTGLGMAPYLINHPQLISRWVEMRELALARIVAAPAPAAARTTAAAAGPRHPPSPGDPYRGRMADRQQPAHPRGHAGPVRLAGRRAAGILESAAGVGDAPLQPAGPGTAQLHPAGTAPGAGG